MIDRAQRISVVVPTWRRPEHLSTCLDALERQLRAADEVVLVVRDDDAATHALLGTRTVSSTLLVVEPEGPGLVPAVATGLRRATGDIVAVTDDDGAPAPNWLALLERAFDDDRVAAVGGRVVDMPEADLTRVRDVGRLSWAGYLVGGHSAGSTSTRRLVQHLQGCNMAFRAPAPPPLSALRGSGHFYELGMCMAVKEIDPTRRIVYLEDLRVEHFCGPRFAALDGIQERRSEFESQSVSAASYNQAYLYAFFTYSRLQRAARLAFIVLIGQARVWGLLRVFLHVVSTRDVAGGRALLRTALIAKWRGWHDGSSARRGKP